MKQLARRPRARGLSGHGQLRHHGRRASRDISRLQKLPTMMMFHVQLESRERSPGLAYSDALCWRVWSWEWLTKREVRRLWRTRDRTPRPIVTSPASATSKSSPKKVPEIEDIFEGMPPTSGE